MTGGTNPVATWGLPNNTTDDASTYKGKLDAVAAVAQRFSDNFAPRQTGTPAMTVTLDAGHYFSVGGLTEVASQTTGTITAPVSNPRIDRVVISSSGVASVITGTPAGSPVAPAIPVGSFPVAQVLLQTTSTVITNSMITDERDFGGLGGAAETRLDIASNSTTDLGSIASNNIRITGTTTITSFGSSASTGNPIYDLLFAGALQLTYDATSMILPGTVNITTAANDTARAEYLGSGNWQVISFNPASGKAVVNPAATSSSLGIVEPDNTTITVSGGVITAATATSSNLGIVKPDNSSITISGGVLTAVPLPAAVVGSLSGTSTVFTVDFTTYSSYQVFVVNQNNGSNEPIVVDVSSNGGSGYASASRDAQQMNSPTTVVQNTSSEGASSTPADLLGTLCQPSTGGTSYFFYSAKGINSVQIGTTVYTTSAAINRIKFTAVGAVTFTSGNVILQPNSKR